MVSFMLNLLSVVLVLLLAIHYDAFSFRLFRELQSTVEKGFFADRADALQWLKSHVSSDLDTEDTSQDYLGPIMRVWEAPTEPPQLSNNQENSDAL